MLTYVFLCYPLLLLLFVFFFFLCGPFRMSLSIYSMLNHCSVQNRILKRLYEKLFHHKISFVHCMTTVNSVRTTFSVENWIDSNGLSFDGLMLDANAMICRYTNCIDVIMYCLFIIILYVNINIIRFKANRSIVCLI